MPGNDSAAIQFGVPVVPEIAEKIGHRGRLQQIGRAERQPADGAQLLLELAGATGVERQMPGVVRTRRQLVDEQLAAAGHEEFDAQDADVVERVHHRVGRLDRSRGERGRHVRRRHGDIEDVMPVHVFDRTEIRPAAVHARARR